VEPIKRIICFYFFYISQSAQRHRAYYLRKKLCAPVRNNNNAWFTVTRYNLYPDLNLEEPEKQEKKRNSQCPLQNLLAEKLLQAAP